MARVNVKTVVAALVLILSVTIPHVISDPWRADGDSTGVMTTQDSGSTATDFTEMSSTQGEDTTSEVASTAMTMTTPPVEPTEKPLPVWVGFIGCLVASIFFGSNLLPVKQFSAGDGVFFQFVFCVAVWIIGLILDRIISNDRFYPLVMLGGWLWTTGNLVTVFCIKTCGLSVGLLIWGTTSLVMGWASGRFGFFGLIAQIPKTNSKLALNYLGVIFGAISGIFFLFIKSNTKRGGSTGGRSDEDRASFYVNRPANAAPEPDEMETDFPFLNRLSGTTQKIIGYVLAAIAGLFYGIMFTPDQYIRDHKEKYRDVRGIPPDNGLYYINSQYSGILLSSTAYFILYSALKRNKPSINPSIAIPAMASGVMWALANIGFILAISALGGAVAYPIVNVLPGIVSSLWSLFLFREIQGKRNYIFLGVGMFVRVLAALFSGLSSP